MTTTRLQRAARRLWDGSELLAHQVFEATAGWVRKGRRDDLNGIAAVLGCILRTLLVLLGLYLLWRFIRAFPNLLWLIVPVWCWQALRAARPAKPGKKPATGEEPSEEAERPADPKPEPPPPVQMPSLEDLRAAVAKVGTPHAHITVLAAALDTTPERVREALARWSIPVEPVRMKGRGSSTGVKAGYFPAPLPPQRTPSESVVAAGQPANNNDNNSPTVDRSAWGITITDPADTHRQQTVRSA